VDKSTLRYPPVVTYESPTTLKTVWLALFTAIFVARVYAISPSTALSVNACLNTRFQPEMAVLMDAHRLSLGGAKIDLEAEQAIRHAFEIGRSGVWLNLAEEQYRKLR